LVPGKPDHLVQFQPEVLVWLFQKRLQRHVFSYRFKDPPQDQTFFCPEAKHHNPPMGGKRILLERTTEEKLSWIISLPLRNSVATGNFAFSLAGTNPDKANFLTFAFFFGPGKQAAPRQ